MVMFLNLSLQAMVTEGSRGVGDVIIPTLSSCFDLQSGNLRYRSSDAITGNEITTLQAFLSTQGFLKVPATGYFGVSTLAAVKVYQASVGLTPTGYVGPLTRAKIKEVSCDIPTTQPVAPSVTTDKTASTKSSLGNETALPLPVKKVLDIPSCLTLEYKACPNGAPMPRQGCSWLPGKCGTVATSSKTIDATTLTPSVLIVPQQVQPTVQKVKINTMPEVACTMVMRLCSDGSAMPRDESCGWHPEKCPADTGSGMQCTKDSVTGQVSCGAGAPASL